MLTVLARPDVEIDLKEERKKKSVHDKRAFYERRKG